MAQTGNNNNMNSDLTIDGGRRLNREDDRNGQLSNEDRQRSSRSPSSQRNKMNSTENDKDDNLSSSSRGRQ